MKNVARFILAQLGYQVSRSSRNLIMDPGTQLRVTLDVLIQLRLSRTSRFVYLQIGANDGVQDDPLVHWRADDRVSGVLVEPQPEPCDHLRSIANERTKVIQAAVSAEPGEATLFRFSPLQTGMNSTVYASFDRNYLERIATQRRLPPESIEGIRVPTIDCDSLRSHLPLSELDLLLIDTEGFDYQVLKLFDLDKNRPVLVCYEDINLARRDRQAAIQLLLGTGYRIAFHGNDVLAAQPQSLGLP
jgi:FkbM family methyltransferase